MPEDEANQPCISSIRARAAWLLAPLVALRMAAWLLIFIALIMSAPPPTPAPSPSPSAHPDRRAPPEQPAPVERPSAKPSQRWAVQADVQRRGTGKAVGTWIIERSQKMYAATEDAAVMKQQQFINEYLHPKVRAARCSNLSEIVLGRQRSVRRRVLACARARASRRSSRMKRPGLDPCS